MNQDESASVVVLVMMVMGYLLYKAGINDLSLEDRFGVVAFTAASLYFLYLFVKRRFA